MKEPTNETELLDAAIALLTSRLPADWSLEKAGMGGDENERDLLLKGPLGASQAPILVEARLGFAPRDVQSLLGGLMRRLRKQTGEIPILLIAPYLSPRARQLLTEEQISYADLTGNVRIVVRQPAVFVELEGAQRDPTSRSRFRGIRGAKAGAVLRVLIDVRPPYTGVDIARAANVNEGYVSRILDSLEDEALIGRGDLGPVSEVDWPALIRRRARELDLFNRAEGQRFVARNGPRRTLESLAEMENEREFVITGSFGAERLAPVAAPAVLVAYAADPGGVAEKLELMPVESGADVILIRPGNDVVFRRAERDRGLLWAAASQVAIDCLAGSGRMPAEGEAVIGWMRENEERWRLPSIRDAFESPERARE